MKIKRTGPSKLARNRSDSGSSLAHEDGWQSAQTGFGTIRDKAVSSSFARKTFQAFSEYEDLYFEDALYHNMCAIPVEEALRQGYSIDTKGEDADPETLADAIEYCEDKGVPALLEQAGAWARGIGGAAILLGIDDGQSMDKPLREDNIKRILYTKVLSARNLTPRDWYSDPLEANFGDPSVYLIRQDSRGGGIAQPVRPIHESRIIRFDGFITTDQRMAANQGWGDPLAVRVEEELQRFWSAFQGMSNALADADQAVFKINGLFKAATSNAAGREAVRARMEQMTNIRSVLRSIAIDKDEDFDYVARQFSGFDTGLYCMMYILSAVSGIPMRLLFGKVPGGFSDTGDAEIKYFYGRVKRYQEVVLMPKQKRLMTILCNAQNSGITLPEKWSIRYTPLMQLTELEYAQLRLTTAQADQIDITEGVLTPEEVSTSHYSGNEYNPSITLRDDLRDGNGDLDEENQPDEPLDPAVAAAMAAAGKVPGQDPGDDGDPKQAADPDGTDPDEAGNDDK